MTAHFVNLLDQLRRRSSRMANLVEDIVEEACEALFQGDQTLARRVMRRDEEVDNEEVEVETEVIRLMALYQPVGSDLRLLCTILKSNNDIERIADCAVNIAERALHIDGDAVGEAIPFVERMWPLVKRQLRDACQAYCTSDLSIAQRVLEQDQVVDDIYSEFVRKAIVDASKSTETVVAAHLDILSVAKNLERIADHATNIAEDVIFLSTGRIVRHQQSA